VPRTSTMMMTWTLRAWFHDPKWKRQPLLANLIINRGPRQILVIIINIIITMALAPPLTSKYPTITLPKSNNPMTM